MTAAQPVKLGVRVESEEGLDWRHWRSTVAAVERLGFDSVWLSDHLASPWFEGRHGLDPFVALSVAAAETSRLRLGTLVSPITFRAPAIVARMAEAIDQVASGRFVLGLGLGWNVDEHTRTVWRFPRRANGSWRWRRRWRASDRCGAAVCYSGAVATVHCGWRRASPTVGT